MFDGWIYYESNPLIKNLHYLNDIPHSYFKQGKSYIDGDIIEYDCFGGMSKLHINTLGDNYTNYPHIVLDMGQDSQIVEIVGVEKEDNKYIIKVKNLPYDENQGIQDIIIKKKGNFYTAEGKGVTYLGNEKILVPVQSYKNIIKVDCAKEP